MTVIASGLDASPVRTVQSEPPVADKSLVAKQFGNASATYDGASRLQRLMGDVMIRALAEDSEYPPLRVLDLGCGTGWFAGKLSQMWPSAKVMGADLSPGMIRQAEARAGSAIDWIVADAEALPLPDQSVDVIFSNLMIQWCSDPGPVLAECRRLLKPGGRLILSTLLEGTLTELVEAWAAADPGRQHVNHFESRSLLQARVSARLPDATVETETITLTYDSPLALAQELKQLGAGFKSETRRKTLTAPGRVRDMCRQYPRQADGTVAASYEAAWVDWRSAR